MIHRTLLRGLVVAGIALVVFGIGHARAGGFTMAHPYAEGGSIDAWARQMSQCVQSVAGVYVEVYGEGKLGRANDIADAVADGIIDLAVLPAAALEKRWPEVGSLGQPGHVYDPNDMIALSDSSGFLRSMNQLGGRDHNLAMLALGWRYATLVGTEMRIDDLQGKRLRTIDTASHYVLERIGALPVKVPFSETIPALEYGYIDGAVVDAEFMRYSIDQFRFDAVNWSPDFAPFASPVVIVMSATAAKAFGDDIPERVSMECLTVTHEFNQRAFDDMTTLVQDARLAGANVISLSAEERAQWVEVLEDIRASRLDDGDPVARAVFEALQY